MSSKAHRQRIKRQYQLEKERRHLKPRSKKDKLEEMWLYKVNVYGKPDFDRIVSLCKERNIKVEQSVRYNYHKIYLYIKTHLYKGNFAKSIDDIELSISLNQETFSYSDCKNEYSAVNLEEFIKIIEGYEAIELFNDYLNHKREQLKSLVKSNPLFPVGEKVITKGQFESNRYSRNYWKEILGYVLEDGKWLISLSTSIYGVSFDNLVSWERAKLQMENDKKDIESNRLYEYYS